MNNLNNDLNRGLYIAVAAGNLESVSALIEAGADINQANVNNISPLFLAAHSGHLEIVNALIAAKANVNQPMQNGATALFMAAQEGHLEIVNTLIAAKANVNQPTESGAIPLMCATENGHLEIVNVLLAANANVNQADKDGRTSLIMAAAHDHTDIIESLFSKGADYESARALAEMKGPKKCQLTLRQSWHAFISKRLEANTDYQDRYQKIKSLISECSVTLGPLYNPIVLFPSGCSIEESSWEGIKSAAMASHAAPLCPQTRKVITSACPNYALKEVNEKLWMEIDALYQEMIGSTPLAAASIFPSEGGSAAGSEGGSAAGSEGGSAASGKKR